MREILFRGKREDNGEWVEGYLLRHNEEYYIYYEEPDEMCQVGNWLLNAKVIPETVGQYIGITDKNGTKIFEGDLMNGVCGKSFFEAAEVRWKSLFLEFFAGDNPLFEDNQESTYEVIGNIHDNPELLKGGEE